MLKVLASIGALQFLTLLVLLVRTKGLALMLGPEMLGIMSVIDKLLAVAVQTVSLSMPFAALRFLPPLWAESRSRSFALALAMRRTVATLTALTGLLGGMLAVFAPGVLGEELVQYRWIVAVGFLTLPVLGLVPLTQNVIAARFAPNRSMIFLLVHAVLASAVALGGIALAGLGGLYALYAAGGVLLLGVVWRQMSHQRDLAAQSIESDRTSESLRFGLPKRIWRFSFALLVLTFVAPYASLYVSYKVLLEHGAEAAGWMQSAVGISLSVRAVLGSAHTVFLTPHVNKGGTPGERLGWAAEFQRTLCFAIALVVPPLLLFPDILVRILYSSSFLPGAAFVVGFVVLEIVTLMAGTYQAIIVAMDRLTFHVAQNVLAQVVTLVVALLLVPTLGILGAALAFLSGQVLLYALTVTYLRSRCDLMIPLGVQALTAGTIVFLLVAGWVGQGSEGSVLSRIGVGALVYALGGAGMTLFLRPEDWRRLREIAAGFGIGNPPAGA